MILHDGTDLQVYSYFSSDTMMNTYIIWHKNKREAILIDPVVFDIGLFEIIEGNGLEIVAVLLTHAYEQYFTAVKTIPKIYRSVVIYGGSEKIYDLPVVNLKDNESLTAAGLEITPLYLPGHHLDSLVYSIEGLIFTGDLLSAGNLNMADANYGRKLLCQCIRETIFTMNEHRLILPLYGPPSTVGIEKETNITIQDLC